MTRPARKRALVVNAYLDDARRPTRRATTVLEATGPPLLAGAFRREACEVRLWNEHKSGPLEDPKLLGWPDMLVLTGMSSAFDRMLHLAAYARTRNPRVAVVAGGPAIRSIPEYSKRFFDYPCTGDVEELVDVVEDAFGPEYADRRMVPRFDLAPWIRTFGHVESTRNCNFACSFCSMTAEGRPYLTYDLDVLRTQILSAGKRRFLLFVDNNFYGSDRSSFRARLDLIGELWREGHFGGWGALVTSDFFFDPDNLDRAKEAGCEALFCGIESFDADSLGRFDKSRNTHVPQVELIRGCLERGVLLVYGMIADVANRSVASLRAELDFVTGCDAITLPSFVVLPIPFPGTPFFRECADEGRLLPGTHLRDLDGTTLCLRPGHDPIPEVAELVRDLQSLRGHRLRALRHALGFARRYRRSLNARQLLVALARDAALAGAPTSVRGAFARRPRRTHVSTTEPLDALYTPAFPVDSRYRDWFRPTPITDGRGELVPELAAELLGAPRRPIPAGAALG